MSSFASGGHILKKLLLKSKCIFPPLEGIKISKPDLRPFARVISSNYIRNLCSSGVGL